MRRALIGLLALLRAAFYRRSEAPAGVAGSPVNIGPIQAFLRIGETMRNRPHRKNFPAFASSNRTSSGCMYA